MSKYHRGTLHRIHIDSSNSKILASSNQKLIRLKPGTGLEWLESNYDIQGNWSLNSKKNWGENWDVNHTEVSFVMDFR